jgi:hypothetical protein
MDMFLLEEPREYPALPYAAPLSVLILNIERCTPPCRSLLRESCVKEYVRSVSKFENVQKFTIQRVLRPYAEQSKLELVGMNPTGTLHALSSAAARSETTVPAECNSDKMHWQRARRCGAVAPMPLKEARAMQQRGWTEASMPMMYDTHSLNACWVTLQSSSASANAGPAARTTAAAIVNRYRIAAMVFL